MKTIADLALQTQTVYERNAECFDRERPKGLHERLWLDRMVEGLSEGDTVLDIGCGAGDPIAGYFLSRGFAVTGIDASSPMIDLAKSRFPSADWLVQDMREIRLERAFLAVIAWHSFFHLTKDEQRAVLPKLAELVLPGGKLMLTVGPNEGEEVGRVGDDQVYHASLSFSEYEAILNTNGLRVCDFVVEDPRCDMATILMAERKSLKP
ncbi:class I SAM-dependent methyltransferase [Nioella aestuarii]|uniref:class I SAM-dependent methyltransferase n=1 Tax=Nioella aestuarii TaxID=1662864 RepID=UPI003D7F6840